MAVHAEELLYEERISNIERRAAVIVFMGYVLVSSG
jgi:hypothetical protein